jgi:hypothetical protein
MAMYSMLADENASTYGRMPGMTLTVLNPTNEPAIPAAAEATLRINARPRE